MVDKIFKFNFFNKIILSIQQFGQRIDLGPNSDGTCKKSHYWGKELNTKKAAIILPSSAAMTARALISYDDYAD